MSAEFDTQNTEEPICPHCGNQIQNSWELFDESDRTAVTDCGSCEKEVFIRRDFDVAYSTEKLGTEESEGIKAGEACGYCGDSGHEDVPCPQRVADAERAVAGFPAPQAPPAELTGIEAAAAIAMEFRVREPDADCVMQRVRSAMAARQAMGREHYGMTLEDNPAPLKERVRHLWEEALDGLAYSQWVWAGWMCPQSHESAPAGRVAMECIKLFSDAIVELDRLMRTLGMDPVRKEGQP